MLQRAITSHRLCLGHRQWLSHSLFRPLQDHRDPIPWQAFSTSLALSEEEKSRLDNSQNPESPRVSSSTPQADDVLPEGNSAHHDLAGDTQDNANPTQATSSRTHTRIRPLRPLLIPPAFPPSLLPVTPVLEPQSSQEQGEATEADFPVTIVLTGLPPDTSKADIRPIFQHFGEVRRIIVQPGGRRAEVVFVDVHCVKRTLHAYAEQPLRVRGEEIVVSRKHARGAGVSVNREDGTGADTAWRPMSSSYSQTEQDNSDGAIFVSDFPPDTTKEELLEALAPLGKYERFVMRPGSKYAYFFYSSDDRVAEILRVHKRVPITLRGKSLRLERTVNRPYSLSPGPSGHSPELGKELDLATSRAIVEELKQTVPRWRGLYGPSRVLWIGRLPLNISRVALTNFWSRLGCVVEVRTSLNGFAHVEFASTEEALRAARQGAQHGFRYAQRLLNVDFAPWVFYIGPAYCVVYISGWPASSSWPALWQWAYDIPNMVAATVLPPFRGEDRSNPRGAMLHFRSIDHARAGLRKLDGRAGPGGETLYVSLSRHPAVHTNQLWQWANAEEEGKEAHVEDEWGGLGFGTGGEEQQPEGVVSGLSSGSGPRASGIVVDADGREKMGDQRVGTRGGRGHWKDWVATRNKAAKRRQAEDGFVDGWKEHRDAQS
ncbi:hypothetical protein BJV74DRAFT_867387 [Russula compacta]|nr:hypothetical protein BJV74DRAFT_867387 [Russula compacta]